MTTLAGSEVVVQRAARLSEDRVYRYWLSRSWATPDELRRTAIFVMLNPSVADDGKDDTTIGRCVGFARAWGCNAIQVVNLYAYVNPDPAAMFQARRAGVEITGGKTNEAVLATSFGAARTLGTPLVAAWGANAEVARVSEVMRLAGSARMQCLGTTKSGMPLHPLYQRYQTPLMPFVWEENDRG